MSWHENIHHMYVNIAYLKNEPSIRARTLRHAACTWLLHCISSFPQDVTSVAFQHVPFFRWHQTDSKCLSCRQQLSLCWRFRTWVSSLPYTSIAIVPRVVIHSLGSGKREAGEEGWSNEQGLLGDLRDLGFNTTYMNLFGKTQKSNPLALTCKCIDSLISLRKTVLGKL